MFMVALIQKLTFSFLPLMKKFKVKIKCSLPSRGRKSIFWLINFVNKCSTRSVAKEPEKWWDIMEKVKEKGFGCLPNFLDKCIKEWSFLSTQKEILPGSGKKVRGEGRGRGCCDLSRKIGSLGWCLSHRMISREHGVFLADTVWASGSSGN